MKALILAACLTLAACAGTPFSYDNARQVKPGMSEDQVYQLMGNPYRVVSRNGEQMWVYSFATALGNAKAVSFKMAGGQVTEVPAIPDSFKRGLKDANSRNADRRSRSDQPRNLRRVLRLSLPERK